MPRPTKQFIIDVDADRYEEYERWVTEHKCTKPGRMITISFSTTYYGPYVEARCHCGQYVDLSPIMEEEDNL